MHISTQVFTILYVTKGCRDLHRMVVGYTTTYTISAIAYHYKSYEFEFHSWRGVLDTTFVVNFQ